MGEIDSLRRYELEVGSQGGVGRMDARSERKESRHEE
jgi:hypothetical protein